MQLPPRAHILNASMLINTDLLLASSVSDVACRYRDADVMLYALGVGFAGDGANPRELDYAYEGRALKVVPTLACNLLDYRFLGESGWDADAVEIVEQKLELYRPLPDAADLRADQRVVAVLDHGRDRGVSVMVESEVRIANDGTVLFTHAAELLAGGRGTGRPSGSGPLPHRLPDREADLTCDLRASGQQALLFRLTGDRRSYYADPMVARAGGLPAPPIHEQCIAGIACRAILQTICDYDFTLVAGFDLRYTGQLFPGETLATEMWQERNIVSFRAIVRERNAVVVDNGKCTLAV